MSGQHHYLEILPEYYQAIEKRKKSFEVRLYDRNFQKGDVLHLRECSNVEYLGRVTESEVIYVLDNPNYCKEGYVIMAIKVIRIEN